MTLSLRERRRQMLHDDIVQTMTGLLAEKSYAGISMDELAAQVGISKPTLYSHFSTKEDILVATIRNMIDQVAKVIESDQAARSPFQQLLFVLETIIQMQVNHGSLGPRSWSPEIIQILCTRQEIFESFHDSETTTLKLVHAAIDSGEIDRSLDPVVVMRAFYAVLNALHAPFMTDARPANSATVAKSLSAIFERGVRAINP